MAATGWAVVGRGRPPGPAGPAGQPL